MSETNTQNSYLYDLHHQPDALANTLASFSRGFLQEFNRYGSQLESGRLKRIVLTGMGSSYHALHPITLGLISHGFQAQMIETSELVYHAPALLGPDTLIIAVSQSGASAEILQLLERVPSTSVLIGVTNTAGSPLANRATSTLLTSAGDESTVSCKTYITTLAALAVLESFLIDEDPFAVVTALASLPEAIHLYWSGLDAYLEYLSKALQGISYLILAGRGASLAAAGTGGLIIKEAAHFPTEGMSSAAFRHGPLEMVSPHTFAVVFEGAPPTQPLNRKLVEDIHSMGGPAMLVENSADRHVFHLSPTTPVGLPILEILPAQVLSLALAYLNNHTPGVFSHGSKITTEE